MKKIGFLVFIVCLSACDGTSFKGGKSNILNPSTMEYPQARDESVVDATVDMPNDDAVSQQTSPGSESSPAPAPDVKPMEALFYPGTKGPYEVTSTTDNLADPAYLSAVIYFPKDPKARIMGATTLSGGFTNTKEQMSWLGEHLASHGVITLVFTPTNNQSLNPVIWATGHKGGLQKLISESQREGSPIQSRVDPKKIGMMGYSMGGAGTILAVNELNTQVKAAVPICAFRPVTPAAAIPILLQTGTADTVAVPRNIETAYEAMSAANPKALAKFNDMTHLDVPNDGPALQHENIAYYGTAWYRVYLDGDERYKTYLNGEESKKKMSAGTFANPLDYRISVP